MKIEKAKKKVTDFLHDQLIEPVQVKRQQKTPIIWAMLIIFVLTSIAISTTYYFLYIHGQSVRIDLDFKDKDSYLANDKKITCDCALPITINPYLIINDRNLKQPEFKNCLQRNLTDFFPSALIDKNVELLLFNFLGVPLNSEIGNSNEYFKNIIISREGPLLTKLGNITLLRYVSEIHNAFMNYFAIYTSDLLESSSWLTYQEDPENHKDIINDLIMMYELYDRKHKIFTNIIGCSEVINYDQFEPDDFLKGITEDDCLPVNCHLFDTYSPFQGLVLIITFYLAVIGYVTCILQCFYQKLTVEEGKIDNDIEMQE